jgi:hypothetical protein
MNFIFHGMMGRGTGVELEIGNLITYMRVNGSRSTGILLDWNFGENGFANTTFLTILLETGVVEKINKDLIYWCELIS